MKILTIDPAQNAEMQLLYAIASLRAEGGRVLKILHGEGALAGRVRRVLRRLKREGRVAYLVPGESFTENDSATRYLLDRIPECKNDGDFEKENKGMTLVAL